MAYESLGGLLQPSGELLPLKDGYFLYNCLESVSGDAIDATKTMVDVEMQDSSHIPKSLAFLDEKIRGKPLFKPGFAHNGLLVCQDEFKTIAERSSLGGVIFERDLAQIFPRQ